MKFPSAKIEWKTLPEGTANPLITKGIDVELRQAEEKQAHRIDEVSEAACSSPPIDTSRRAWISIRTRSRRRKAGRRVP